MEIKVGSEVRKVSDECEKVVLGVVEKSGKSVEEVLEVVYFMFCFKREGVEGVWDIEWDDCELEYEECVWYERIVMEVCKELDVELKYW